MTKLISVCQAAAVVLFCAAVPAVAQDAATPPQFTADALDQLLRPIALYPDPLLAEIFTAATMPEQIVMADRYVNDGGDLSQIAEQPWDACVQALAHYPTVLKWLDDNLPWTTEVGQAFLYQQGDVMTSIQHLRYLAQEEGNLPSTPQENVVNDNGNVEIEPANPDEMYVPTYPWDAIYFNAGVPCTFGVGFPIGLWLRHDWDWRNHHVIAWGPGHERPGDWWHRPPAQRVAPRGVAVWHGPSRAPAGVARNADRGFAPETFRPARQVAPAAPRPMTANRTGSSVDVIHFGGANAARGNGAATGTGSSVGVIRFGAGQSTGTRPFGGATSIPSASRPAPEVHGSSGGGAFGGSESSSETRQSSQRGAESHSAMPAPSAPAHSSAPSGGGQSSQSSSHSSGSSRGR
jgi:hypothetical protein